MYFRKNYFPLLKKSCNSRTKNAKKSPVRYCSSLRIQLNNYITKTYQQHAIVTT